MLYLMYFHQFSRNFAFYLNLRCMELEDRIFYAVENSLMTSPHTYSTLIYTALFLHFMTSTFSYSTEIYHLAQ